MNVEYKTGHVFFKEQVFFVCFFQSTHWTHFKVKNTKYSVKVTEGSATCMILTQLYVLYNWKLIKWHCMHQKITLYHMYQEIIVPSHQITLPLRQLISIYLGNFDYFQTQYTGNHPPKVTTPNVISCFVSIIFHVLLRNKWVTIKKCHCHLCFIEKTGFSQPQHE